MLDLPDGGQGAIRRSVRRTTSAKPACGGPGFGEQRPEPGVQLPSRRDGPAGFGPGLDEELQGGHECGGPGFGAVHVEVHGDGLPDGLGELPGGAQRLVGGLLPDPGDLPQPVASGVQHLLHGVEPGRLDGGHPQPPLGDLGQPVDGDPPQLEAGQLRVDRRPGLPYGFDGPPVVGQQRAGRRMQPLARVDRLGRPVPHAPPLDRSRRLLPAAPGNECTQPTAAAWDAQ